MSIIIKKKNDDVFIVTVSRNTSTIHQVIVSDDIHLKLTDNLITKEVLVKYSFEFLLDREPNTSILRSFEISEISRYFSEYEDKVNSWCYEL
ncbi:MAG: hypothetical protein CMD67_03770 [Gammaproteobacteria bacterium]|nr:hypothetical protein [Gammaproteobacteria bacterium]|tara:strand:- start:261 stop:536 length:276 start_codon:yes stop_codon:yes gene_type:complete